MSLHHLSFIADRKSELSIAHDMLSDRRGRTQHAEMVATRRKTIMWFPHVPAQQQCVMTAQLCKVWLQHASCTCVVVENNVVPLMSRLQQHFAFLGHPAHVNPLICAIV